MSCSQIKKSKQNGSLNQIKTIVDFELSNEITFNFNFNFLCLVKRGSNEKIGNP